MKNVKFSGIPRRTAEKNKNFAAQFRGEKPKYRGSARNSAGPAEESVGPTDYPFLCQTWVGGHFSRRHAQSPCNFRFVCNTVHVQWATLSIGWVTDDRHSRLSRPAQSFTFICTNTIDINYYVVYLNYVYWSLFAVAVLHMGREGVVGTSSLLITNQVVQLQPVCVKDCDFKV